MAEGGIKVVDDGSEPMFDHECTHLAHACRQEAVKSCKECKTLLCQDCLIHHERNIKAHTLVYIDSMSKSQITKVGKIPTMFKCLNHPDRDIEMYCGSHDMVYCSLCVAKNHRSCKRVKEIQDVPHSTNLSSLQKLVADLTNVNQRLQETKLAQKRIVKDLKSMKASILKEITALRKRMNDHLDVLEDQLIAELDAEQSILEDEANKEVKETNGILTAIEQQKPNMTTTYDPTQMFILEKVAQSAFVNADKFLRRTASTKRQTLVFEHNEGLLDTIEDANRFGKLVRRDINPTRTQPRPYTMKSVSQTNKITFSDFFISTLSYDMFGANDRNLIITDMCQHSDGTILLIDELELELKRLNDRLRVNDIYGFYARPKGMCLKSPTEVAVLLSNGTINILKVGRSLSYKGEIKLQSTGTYRTMKGLAYCSNRFWTLGENAIYIFTQSGSLVKTIDRDTHGVKIFFQALNLHGIAVSNDGSLVFVTAGDDRVVVFNKYGYLIQEFRDGRLNGTNDICFTSDDIVLVSGYTSRNVLMFDLEGECLGELISRKELTNELYNPRSMCFDNQKRRLLVSVRHKIMCYDLS